MADEQPTMASAAQLSFVNSVIRGLGKDFNAELMKKVREVTVADIQKAMGDILLPAFSPGTANVVITCAPIMEEVSLLFLSPLFSFLELNPPRPS